MATNTSTMREKAKAVIIFKDFDKDALVKFTLSNLSQRVTKESIYELGKAIEVILGPERKMMDIEEEITDVIIKSRN